VEVVSVLARPLAVLHPAILPGRRVLLLVGDGDAATAVCGLLRGRGYGPSGVTVLERLGAADEQQTYATAAAWPGTVHDPLAIVAVECRAEPGVPALPRIPGLPDEAFEHDGQITKREIRAVVLSALAPVPGELLWDVGAGSGSVGIEWLRTHPACRAVAVEPRADRRRRIAANADALGVPGLRLVDGTAPAALAGLPAPDAVFIGGGVSVAGVVEACLAALRPGGRLVANAVTIEAEGVLAAWHRRLGGALIRLSVDRAEPLGTFTGWRPARPVTQWSYHQEGQP
jgi:precorrin-6Y C5,15-methyltransferase (decarboxylating)